MIAGDPRGAKGRLAVVHRRPGRLRLRLPRAASPGGAERVARQLPGVRSARASRHTRSLLLTYDPGEITADALIDALMAALGLVAAEADDVGSMFLGARQLGVAVSRLVGGRHILIALLALGVGLWAGRALLRSKKLRLGWLPLLLAYSLVRELRPGSPAPARQRRI